MSVKNFIYSQIRDITDINIICDSFSLRNDLGMDSLDQLDLVVRIQKEYKLQNLDENAINHVRTVGNLIDVVEAVIPSIHSITKAESGNGNIPVLYTIKNNIPYCRVTDKQCQNLRAASHIVNPCNCNATRCKIARNLQKILAELQKTK